MGDDGINTTNLVFERPKRKLFRDQDSLVEFQKNRCYKNPFSHLLSCYKLKTEAVKEFQRRTTTENKAIPPQSMHMIFEQTESSCEKVLYAYHSQLYSIMLQFFVFEMITTGDFRSSKRH